MHIDRRPLLDLSAAQAEAVAAEAIRLALKDWLTGMGLLQHSEDPEKPN